MARSAGVRAGGPAVATTGSSAGEAAREGTAARRQLAIAGSGAGGRGLEHVTLLTSNCVST
jgi:hypothetical protein